MFGARYTGQLAQVKFYKKIRIFARSVSRIFFFHYLGIETFRIALLQLFDDGQYGDLVANDGIYTAIYRDFLSQGKYKMRFFANGDEGSARISRSGFIGRKSGKRSRERRDLRSQKAWAMEERSENLQSRMTRTERKDTKTRFFNSL